jgi:hypothetical protein
LGLKIGGNVPPWPLFGLRNFIETLLRWPLLYG